MMSYVALLVGLLFVIKGADYLVQGASSFARNMHVSDFVIGLTVVSFGTSLPELVVALAAGSADSPGLIIGNAIGSNIANVLLVLGASAAVYPLTATNNTVWKEIPFTLLASIVLWLLLNDDVLDSALTPTLSRSDGLILLAFFVVFLYYVAQVVKSDKQREWVGEQISHNPRRAAIEFVGGAVALIVGSRIVVSGATDIARSWGVSDELIGLTLIAIGTSLPELATSVVAAYRKNVDIAVGNVVGSNIFNIFIVLGVSSVVHPIAFDTTYNADLLVMVASTVLLFIFMFLGHPRRTIQRKEGWVFVAAYIAYLVYLVRRG